MHFNFQCDGSDHAKHRGASLVYYIDLSFSLSTSVKLKCNIVMIFDSDTICLTANSWVSRTEITCITNHEFQVKARIGNAIGQYKDLLTSVKRHKLKWYERVTRSSGLAKTRSYREQFNFKEGDEEADRGNDGKTTSKSGLALNEISYCGKLRIARSGESWLWNLQWCPNSQPDYGIGEIRKNLNKKWYHRYCISYSATTCWPHKVTFTS